MLGRAGTLRFLAGPPYVWLVAFFVVPLALIAVNDHHHFHRVYLAFLYTPPAVASTRPKRCDALAGGGEGEGAVADREPDRSA